MALDAAPPDTGTGVAADPAPGVAVPVITTGPITDMEVGTADGLLPGVADFDPTSAWGDGDDVTAAIPDGADFDPTSLDSVWVDGGDATAAIPTSVWGDGDEVTAAIPEAVPTRKRKHTAAARADDTDDGATATAVSAAGASPRPTKGRKRTSSRGPAHAARRAAFLAAQEHGTTGIGGRRRFT